MTQRINQWVSHMARQNWRAMWSEKLFGLIVPHLRQRGDSVTTVVAKGALPELTRRLSTEHATSRVLDARRPRSGHDLQPVTADQPTGKVERWSVPGAVLGMGRGAGAGRAMTA